MKINFCILFLLCGSLTCAAEYNLELRTGNSLTGEITACDSAGITVAVSGQSQQYKYDDIAAVSVPNTVKSDTIPAGRVQVTLSDGSVIYPNTILLENGTAQLPLGNSTYSVKESNVNIVRFNLESSQDQAWAEILKTEASQDLLFVAKKDKLSYYRGVVHQITADKIPFKLDGDLVPVSRTKAFGLRLTRAVESMDSPELCIGITSDSSRWAIGTLSVENGVLVGISRLGIKIPVGNQPENIQRIEFSQVPAVYLSDLDIESWNWTPFVEAAGMPESILRKFNQPRKDKAFGDTPLAIDQKTFEHGLCIRSKTEIIYRLSQSYSRLTAEAGIDNISRPKGNLTLEIFADSNSVYKQTIQGTEKAKQIDVPITGAKRIKILVDFGADASVGDTLTIGNPQLIE